MKTLIIGELINNNLSSGTLEILSKATSLDLDVQVITVGSDENPSIGLDNCKQTYLKRKSDSLNLSKAVTKISEIIENEGISLILGSSTYMCRDIIAGLSGSEFQPSFLADNSINDLILSCLPVAITKSLGSVCCNIFHCISI